jgi:hypothetical protein
LVVPSIVDHRSPAAPSAAVRDLQILNRNEQAFQQLDALQQDDDDTAQPDAPAGPPAS